MLAEQTSAPQIWLAPPTPGVGPDGGQWGSEDFFQLADPGSPWQTVANRTSVFKIYPEFASRASDEEILRVSRGMAARDIPLALEAPILVETETCAPGVKKGSNLVAIVNRLKRLGVDLRYIDMNGPLIVGHISTRSPYCHAPIKAVAADAAAMAQSLRKIYPDLQFGDVEPVGKGPNFVDGRELPEWLDAFKDAAGFPIHHIHIDVNWGRPWRDDLQRVAAASHASGVAFGVIFDSDNTQLSDAQWASATTKNYLQVENLLGPQLDDVVFQSWGRYPRHALPETSPTSLTGVVLRYFRAPVTIDMRPDGSARLLDRKGQAVAGAKIIAQVADNDPNSPLQKVSFSGVTPADTTKARLGLRFNTECACEPGATHLTLGGFAFSQQGRPAFRWNTGDWPDRWGKVASAPPGKDAVTFAIPVGQKVIINGPEFPVFPDAPFQLSFDVKGDSDGKQTGVLVVIFADARGERHRTFHHLGVTWTKVAEATTDGKGVAPFAPLPPSRGISREIRYVFAGDALRRPFVTSPQSR